ncbi:GNAT family N-acetyltransferase [Sphingobacterium sp. UBA6320]|jgi:N-acetylglutamate synthase-like GNAT family acetyltransferase|uniref:GNAT family N-acetyltransferase n=1 Tax=Sphingobacterium sp. UBA6320 TaxID=1947510 RepID=UPI0025D84238|nr:GNAT family N-acetyltransferase [Sphingobacterium sp. UBA6320]
MKENYAIQKLADGTPIPYELLLLADETKEAINKYIFDCTIFTLINEKSNDLVGVMAILQLDQDTVELKNMAIAAHEQSQGFGSDMLSFLKSYARDQQCQQIWVGTADIGYLQHRFYMRNGFEMDHIRKNFFLDHYDVPIIEHGIQMKHMLVFSYRLKT